jgi:hypothetical protein
MYTKAFEFRNNIYVNSECNRSVLYCILLCCIIYILFSPIHTPLYDEFAHSPMVFVLFGNKQLLVSIKQYWMRHGHGVCMHVSGYVSRKVLF